MQVAHCFSLSPSSQRDPQAAARTAVAAPQSHCGPGAVSECVLSLLALVLQSAATMLSGGKPPAFLPVGGSRHFRGGGSWNVCVHMHMTSRAVPVAVLSGSSSDWCCAPRPVVNNCPRQPRHAAAATLSRVVPPLFGGKVSFPSSSFSSPVCPRVGTEIPGP